MKKWVKEKIAFMLACTMLFSTLQGISIFAAEESKPLEFELLRQMLVANNRGLEVASRDKDASETALAKWNIKTAGQYELNYFIETESGGVSTTKKIVVSLDNQDTKKADLSIATYTAGNSACDENDYTEMKFDNASVGWVTGDSKAKQKVITKAFSLGSMQNREDQEFYINLTNIAMKEDGNKQANLMLRVKIDGDYMYVYTNGIAKGNITPFKLYYRDSASKTDITTEASKGIPIAEDEIFNGPKGYAIAPTHLYTEGGTLKDLALIEDIRKNKPGSVPGVKVSFDQIKEIDGDKFEYVNDIVSSEANITLILGTRYTLDSMSNSIRLDFKPKSNEKIKLDLKETANVVQVEGNKVFLYLSETVPKEADASRVIVWEALKTSTIVDGSFQYGNNSEKYWPSNKGYTYLGYSLNKTSSNQVQLNIQPYNIKSKATYSIYVLSNPGDRNTKPSVVYEYDPNKTETNNISAIVPVQSPSYFKIEVTIGENTFISQMVYYHPESYQAVPEVTTIKSIEDVYVVPSENSQAQNAQPQAIGFDMTWLAPSNVQTLLEKGTLYYELILRKDKDDYDPLTNTGDSKEDVYGTYSKAFKVSLNDKGEVIVTTVAGTAGKEYEETPEVRYDPVNGTFSMESISLMNFGAEGNKWEQLEIEENHFDYTQEDENLGRTSEEAYLNKITGTAKDSLRNRTVPGTYYLSLRTVLATDGSPVVYSEESNLVSLSLDNTNEIIPVPETITGEESVNEDKTFFSEEISIQNVDIRNYVKKMLEPANLYLYKDVAHTLGRYSGEYEIYLYQDAGQLATTILGIEKGKLTPIKLSSSSNEIDLSKTDANSNKKYIEKLRNGEVIPISLDVESLIGLKSDPAKLKLIGLDPNEVYYAQVRVKLSPWRNNLAEAGSEEIPSRYSLFSKEFTFTTSTTPLPPTPDDKIPPTPEEIRVVEQPNNTTVTIGWKPAEFEADEDISKTYYEFIRTDLQLIKDDRGKTVEDLVAENSERVGFRSDSPTGSNPVMSTYTSKDKAWTNLSPEQASNKLQLTDDTLSPNNIYYYYVRTVCMIDGKAVKSDWIMVPVTTSPISPVINLKVELPKDYSYEPKNEVVISFDAPVPSEDLVPEDYDFDIAIQGEMDDEYTTSKYTVKKVTSKEDSSLTPEGYTHFVYKISELKPNKRYFIKVRVIDKTKELTDGGTYPTSLYCDPVTTRTEYDEEEDEKDNKYEEYLKKYDSEVDKLRRKPYWVVEEGSTYKYRESYINTELGLQSTYQLVGGENTNSLYYYMPASLFIGDNNINTVLEVIIGDYSANIRPYTLTKETDEIKEAVELMDENSLKDYYVGITFSLRNTSISISNEDSITPQITVDMELVYVKEKDSDVELKIMDALEELISDERKDVIKQLEKKVYDGTIADDVLADIIEDAISEVEEEHTKDVKKIMDRTTKKTVIINQIEKAILLMAKMDYSAVNGYYQLNGWVSVDVYSVGGGFAIEANRLGFYVFTGQPPLINTVPSLAPYQSFIAKYNLTDFFTLDSYMIKTAATKEQVYSALARVLGASRGSDYINYLKGKEMKGVNSISKANAIRQDESIYVIMQGYEILHNRKITSIVIKNKQSVQNIGAFQTPYRDYVYAGVELKIVNNPNAKVVPSKQMTVEEIIIMLYKIQA